ncbi:hypothetical protein H101_08030 [Trichophyton interdigitale H6]|nr:hypothetical protein H101_08030 [Trichophyton interdigitale H6]
MEKAKRTREDKRSDHQIFNRSRHKGTDHVPKSTKVLDTSIHPIGLFLLDQLLHASAIFIGQNAVDIGQPGFQGPTQSGQREAKDALLRSLTMVCIMFGSLRPPYSSGYDAAWDRACNMAVINQQNIIIMLGGCQIQGTNEMDRLAAL